MSLNRLQESLEIFERIVNGQRTANTICFLILTKKDVFNEKIKTTALSKTFPEYKGGSDYDQAIEFIKGLYLAQLKDRDPSSITCYVICTLDTEEVRLMFKSVRKLLHEGSAPKTYIFGL
jgi:guanine nucleotide-binding protein G(i) subunit alpha